MEQEDGAQQSQAIYESGKTTRRNGKPQKPHSRRLVVHNQPWPAGWLFRRCLWRVQANRRARGCGEKQFCGLIAVGSMCPGQEVGKEPFLEQVMSMLRQVKEFHSSLAQRINPG